ncbi:hypothetical protein J2776_000797 [Paraburkholderia caledonica]|uniref:Uncharacterized protein n=1 Tax=Paraburkholderia caledonica TaxID=134536 RepID=A0ABU1KT43_9BURK|nr:hypothetical protein [Paraburkholderia caledonica]
MFKLPLIAKVRDEACFDVVLVRQVEEFVARERRLDIGDRLADQ